MYELSIVPRASNHFEVVLKGQLPKEEKEIRLSVICDDLNRITYSLNVDSEHTISLVVTKHTDPQNLRIEIRKRESGN